MKKEELKKLQDLIKQERLKKEKFNNENYMTFKRFIDELRKCKSIEDLLFLLLSIICRSFQNTLTYFFIITRNYLIFHFFWFVCFYIFISLQDLHGCEENSTMLPDFIFYLSKFDLFSYRSNPNNFYYEAAIAFSVYISARILDFGFRYFYCNYSKIKQYIFDLLFRIKRCIIDFILGCFKFAFSVSLTFLALEFFG
jgi:hypothetical protein